MTAVWSAAAIWAANLAPFSINLSPPVQKSVLLTEKSPGGVTRTGGASSRTSLQTLGAKRWRACPGRGCAPTTTSAVGVSDTRRDATSKRSPVDRTVSTEASRCRA
jgi:hypothetical protein